MRLPALAVQLQGFTHSANKANVGVNLRKACVGKMHCGSLIPTYKLGVKFV